MSGNGVDMYNLINGLTESSEGLEKQHGYFWVGVIEKMSPSPPVPRRKTNCYTKADVYLYNGRYVFSMIRNYETNNKDFYYIPESELIFIERPR